MADTKAYKKTDRILIENSKTGEQYGVTGAAFDAEYEALGFRAVSFEDGTPLELSKGEKEAASRAAKPSSENVGPAGAATVAAVAAPKKAASKRIRKSAKKSSTPTGASRAPGGELGSSAVPAGGSSGPAGG